MESCGVSALDRPAAELTVVDVYDLAAALGRDFERIIERFGCESLVGVVPKVVRVLELLEALVSSGTATHEAEELKTELERLRQERSERSEQEKKHQKELEQVEDVWRGEVQDLISQMNQLQAQNKKLLVSLSLKESPVPEEELHKPDGMSEKEKQVMKKLKELVDKQRDEIRAKDHELTLKHQDIEALQMQQLRLIRINQDLRHRTGVMEARGKALIQQKAELEAAAQTQQQEVDSLQLEASRLRTELQAWQLDRELTDRGETSGTSPPTSPLTKVLTSNSNKANSVWVECGRDPDFLANCFERDRSPSLLPRSWKRETPAGGAAALPPKLWDDSEPDEELDLDRPRFTLQELRDVLQEKNQLKAQVFMLQEELAYYKSDDSEDEVCSSVCPPSPPPSTDQESGIRRLLFTAIMPMVAAGLIADDPTLCPIRRLSFCDSLGSKVQTRDAEGKELWEFYRCGGDTMHLHRTAYRASKNVMNTAAAITPTTQSNTMWILIFVRFGDFPPPSSCQSWLGGVM